jgi:hypothetical protein
MLVAMISSGIDQRVHLGAPVPTTPAPPSIAIIE